MSKNSSDKSERLTYYLTSLLSTLITVGLIELWVEAGKITFNFRFEDIAMLIVGAIAEFFAIANFREIEKKCFWDYFFLIFVVAGGLCAILGGLALLVATIFGWYVKEELKTPVNTNSDDKPDEYHIGKDVAGYDRIKNQDGKEITSIASISDNGDVYGTDGNKYSPKK